MKRTEKKEYGKKEYLIIAFYNIVGFMGMWIGIALMTMPKEVEELFYMDALQFYKMGCLILGGGIVISCIGIGLIAEYMYARFVNSEGKDGK